MHGTKDQKEHYGTMRLACGVLASVRIPQEYPARKCRQCRIPEPAVVVVVGAFVGGRSVSRRLVGADGGARFAAVRSKHGEMNRKGPRASRHARLCFGAMSEQSTRGR